MCLEREWLRVPFVIKFLLKMNLRKLIKHALIGY